MKAIQELAAIVERWWPFEHRSLKYRGLSQLNPKLGREVQPLTRLKFPVRPGEVSHPVEVNHPVIEVGSPYGSQQLPPVQGKLSPCRAIKRRKGIRHPRLAFAVTALTLTAILGQRFYNQPGLQVGSVAPETIFAPAAARVEDKETTEERRRDARNGALPVLKIDSAANETALKSLDSLLAQVGSIRQAARTGPFVSTSILSTPIQNISARLMTPPG
ncbi:MAG: hypothetical protein HC922_10360 [Leptolyngbyaceae cyanobacterium SM2_3_12]|nr:hypothetical protein [Leptolyngbyaceae cyanobacterium SM2_3_12]